MADITGNQRGHLISKGPTFLHRRYPTCSPNRLVLILDFRGGPVNTIVAFRGRSCGCRSKGRRQYRGEEREGRRQGARREPISKAGGQVEDAVH